jgi:hypothetical protein
VSQNLVDTVEKVQVSLASIFPLAFLTVEDGANGSPGSIGLFSELEPQGEHEIVDMEAPVKRLLAREDCSMN